MSGRLGSRTIKEDKLEIPSRIEYAPFNKFEGTKTVLLAYLLSALLWLVVGATGPQVINLDSTLATGVETGPSVEAEFLMSGVTKWHQVLYTKTRMNNAASSFFEGSEIHFTNTYTISTWGSNSDLATTRLCPNGCFDCPFGSEDEGFDCTPINESVQVDGAVTCWKGKQWCSWQTLESQHHLDFTHYYYRITVSSPLQRLMEEDGITAVEGVSGLRGPIRDGWEHEFDALHVMEEWSWHLMAWYMSLCFVTLVAMLHPRLGFFTSVLKRADKQQEEGQDGREWNISLSKQQRWVCVLLPALLLFNNPLYALEIFRSDHKGYATLHIILVSAFLCLLLLYCLHLFEAISSSRTHNAPHPYRGYLSKTLAFCIFVSHIETFSILYEKRDLSQESSNGAKASEISLGFFAALFLVWLAMAAVRSGVAIAHVSAALKGVWLLALITCAVIFRALFIEAYMPFHFGSLSFALTNGLLNSFMLVLVFLYAPASSSSVIAGSHHQQQQQLTELVERGGGEYEERRTREDNDGDDEGIVKHHFTDITLHDKSEPVGKVPQKEEGKLDFTRASC